MEKTTSQLRAKAELVEPICELCTGTHPSWMCVDHLKRGALLEEIYKLRKTLLAIKPNEKPNPKRIRRK